MFSHANKPARGIIFTISGVVFGLIVGVLIKRTASEASLLTVLFYRFVFSIPLLLCFCVYSKGKNFLKIEEKKNDAVPVGLRFSWNGFLDVINPKSTARSSDCFISKLSPFCHYFIPFSTWGISLPVSVDICNHWNFWSANFNKSIFTKCFICASIWHMCCHLWSAAFDFATALGKE